MDTSRLIFPKLGGLYRKLGDPVEALLRITSGLALVTHGWPKIQDPLSRAGWLEGMGFWPGEFWAVGLAVIEFFGGILVALGLFTRPAALGASIVLAVTIWYHWFLQAEGFSGAEKSILWTAIMLYFAVHGARAISLDKLMRREF